MGVKTFAEDVRAHKFRVLACLLGPRDCILKCDPSLRKDLAVIPSVLCAAVEAESLRDWERIAKWYWAGFAAVT